MRIFHNRERRENVTASSQDTYRTPRREDIPFRICFGAEAGGSHSQKRRSVEAAPALPKFLRSWSEKLASARSLFRERHACGKNRPECLSFAGRRSYWRH